MKTLYDKSSLKVAKLITKEYSTSFSIGIRLLSKSIRPQIYAIYGFVRIADEIVDSFEGYAQTKLFYRFVSDYQHALEHKISTNPILNAFQQVVLEYRLQDLVEAFLQSMEMDLNKKEYDDVIDYQRYIHGSAEVVGLMCLKVFVENDDAAYEALKPAAIKLGSAFQKVNFLRDINDDMARLGRSYFHNVADQQFGHDEKEVILKEIKEEFDEALVGIKQLNSNCKLGVYVAYKYYLALWHVLNNASHAEILKRRIRVSDPMKLYILLKAATRYKINLL